MPSQRKKEDNSLNKSPAEVDSIVKEEQVTENVKAEESLNKSLVQPEQHVSNFLKVAADQESINTSGGGSDVQ